MKRGTFIIPSSFDPAYRRFRAELRAATYIDEAAFAEWIRQRNRELAIGYLLTGEGGGVPDLLAWASFEYLAAQRGSR